MTTFWPKRDEDGRHVNTGAEHGGPIANFKPSCEPDHVETLKPLSELLAKLDPDVVERARAGVTSDPVDLLEGDDLHQYMAAILMWPLMPLNESIERRNKLAKDILNKNKSKCAKCDGKGYIAYPMNGAVICECNK